MEPLTRLLDTTDFVPRTGSAGWSGELVHLHVISDTLIGLAYIAIPAVLVYFVRRRRDVPFPWVFWLFGVFILGCGATHLMEAVVTYWPYYRLAGLVKLLTAAVSIAAAVAMIPLVPRALALRSPDALQQEIAQRTAELARVNATLSASEARFRQLADAMPQIVWTAGPDGQLEYFNRRWYDFTGFPDGQLESDWTTVLHADDLQRCLASWYASLRSGQPFQVEYRMRDRATGQYRWHLGRALPARDEAGQVVRWFGTSTDIHDQKLAEQALRRQEERLRTALAASGTGTFRWDLRNNALECDDSLDHLLGLPAGQTVDHVDEFLHIVHPEDRPAVAADCQQAASAGSDFQRDFRVVWADGSIHWLAGRGKTFADATGRPRAMAGACVDITAHKYLEAALRDADRRKDEFLATLAHELRNPLAPLRNALEILHLAGSDPATLTRMRAMMERQLGHLIRLVDDLLDVSRITRGKIVLRRERLDLAEPVQSAVEASRPLMEAAHHTFTMTLPPEPLHVEGDLTRLAQVLANLLNNAAKYTPAGGAITLTAERAGTEAVLQVRDNGVGIPRDMLQQVFEMFTQVDGTRDRAQGGLGLGLTLVRRLVEMHGGTVSAQSEGPGSGSTFTVRLPLLGE